MAEPAAEVAAPRGPDEEAEGGVDGRGLVEDGGDDMGGQEGGDGLEGRLDGGDGVEDGVDLLGERELVGEGRNGGEESSLRSPEKRWGFGCSCPSHTVMERESKRERERSGFRGGGREEERKIWGRWGAWTLDTGIAGCENCYFSTSLLFFPRSPSSGGGYINWETLTFMDQET